MKIFVFEFISGGGMNDQTLPESLVREGELMLQALTKDLSPLHGIELYITRDFRLPENFFCQFNNIHLIQVAKDSDIKNIFTDLCHQCDAVWPIAPESDGILAEFCEIVAASNTRLLNTAAEAVEITGNKLTTFRYLSKKKIPVILTNTLSGYQWQPTQTCIIKPIDGVGCENCVLISNKAEFEQVTANITNPDDYIVQPYTKGRAISLSCLFKNRRAWLICCNKQQVNVKNQRILLTACVVNITTEQRQAFTDIICAVADLIPNLWGYVGIDLIETSVGPKVLEINPRLTTSYAGIKTALGVNIAENVLQLINSEPSFKITQNHPVTIAISS
jgi:predicted ATP-grasp superfamily ATP-dependent carboligase